MDELKLPQYPTKEHLAAMMQIPGYQYCHHVGSSVFMDGEDIDYAIVIERSKLADARAYMMLTEWEDCSAEDYQMGGTWRAYRKGKLNFILTTDAVWAQKFANAAQVAKLLNLTDKETRVKVNWIIRDDWSADAAKETPYEPDLRE